MTCPVAVGPPPRCGGRAPLLPPTEEPPGLSVKRTEGFQTPKGYTVNDTPNEQRTGYITGLRQLADLLEQHPELPTPWTGSEYDPIQLAVWTTKEQLATIVAALPKPITKDTSSETTFRINGMLAGLHVSAYAGRPEVCERVVTGTVTVTLPAVEAQPERTEEREVVQWRCTPLLADVATEGQLDNLLAAVETSPSSAQVSP